MLVFIAETYSVLKFTHLFPLAGPFLCKGYKLQLEKIVGLSNSLNPRTAIQGTHKFHRSSCKLLILITIQDIEGEDDSKDDEETICHRDLNNPTRHLYVFPPIITGMIKKSYFGSYWLSISLMKNSHIF